MGGKGMYVNKHSFNVNHVSAGLSTGQRKGSTGNMMAVDVYMDEITIAIQRGSR